MSFGLYVHYPYCRRVCPYCDFCVEASHKARNQNYTDALINELELRVRASDINHSVGSIYLGGGTPSLWPLSQLSRFLQHVFQTLAVEAEAEITLELNPEDVSEDLLRDFRRLGINRLSIGAQSLRDEHLRKLGRAHTRDDVYGCIDRAQKVGFDNWSVDLIHGVVGQSVHHALKDVADVIGLGTPHISTYQLTIETGTRFFERQSEGETVCVGDDCLALMYAEIRELMTAHGLRHYEVSNAALPGFESRHNLGYWTGRPYLALGAGAHGFLLKKAGGIRYENTTKISTYIDEVPGASTCDQLPSISTSVSQLELEEDLLMTGLRLMEGIVPSQSMVERYLPSFLLLKADGLLRESEGRWQATIRGREILNFVTDRLLNS